MSIWDVALDRLQASRLLALRMHVARYVVREGVRRRSVAVVMGEEERARYGDVLLEVLEAAGAERVEVVSAAPVPEADIVLVSRHQGDAALPLDPLADSSKASLAALARPPSLQVWAVDFEKLAGVHDARIVGSVESLIRIVLPEALGANGTPPDESVAVRVV